MRVVVFLAGCLLRCQFCHNPDTWARSSGREMTVAELARQVGGYAKFTRACGGGVTFSGGEPLVQWPFVLEAAKALKLEHGMHVAVQTAGFLGPKVSDELVDLVDLWMVDLKSADAERYHEVTGVRQANVLRFMERLAERKKRVWATYVLVPGLTDDPGHLTSLGRYVAELGNVERIELRPFHQMGRQKWAELGEAYRLEATASASKQDVARALDALRGCGVEVVVG